MFSIQASVGDFEHSVTWNWMTYLTDSDLPIFPFCTRIMIRRCPCILVLRKIDRGATSADSVIEEHAIPLHHVSERFGSLSFIG